MGSTVGPVVVTSRVTLVVVVTGGSGGSSAQPISPNGVSVKIQLRILMITPPFDFRFSLDELALFKFDALPRRHADRKSRRHHAACARNSEGCRSRCSRGHATLRNFVEALSDRQA